ncbi:hypothetical protein Taro_011380 [Colocasia esculenta]|uniref:Uncharacterized protein n=1 Tax=Colocasia esculenta TaxID=4460 RepID=A0A843UCE3_COLES|nr:hypothetical protein [Colocasia esculenta]
MNSLAHGKQEEVGKKEFKVAVLSDRLLGMADELRRDSIVILGIDGEDLRQFRRLPYSLRLHHQLVIHRCAKLLPWQYCPEQLSIDHGMPPPDDAWRTFIEPALQSLSPSQFDLTISQQTSFLEEIKKALHTIAERLDQQHPVIVAHCEKTFDGHGPKRLLANQHELDKVSPQLF